MSDKEQEAFDLRASAEILREDANDARQESQGDDILYDTAESLEEEARMLEEKASNLERESIKQGSLPQGFPE